MRWQCFPLIALGCTLPAGLTAEEGGDLEARLEAQEARIQALQAQVEAVRVSLEPAPAASFLADPLAGLVIGGSVSQGFAWCDAPHKYLTLDTDRGTFAWTDMTLRVTKHISDELQVGIQLYNRIFGDVGRHQFELDYANLDYRWREWLGLKAGRVKTRHGLYNDTQDQDALHPWAFPPLALYDPANRGLVLNHDGFDLYGDVDLGPVGTLRYTGFLGTSLLNTHEKLALDIQANGGEFEDIDIQYMTGGDLQWIAGGRLAGLRLGGSYHQLEWSQRSRGYQQLPPFGPPVPPVLITPFTVTISTTEPMRSTVLYAEYEVDDLKLAAEWKYFDSHLKTAFRYPGLIPLVQHRDQKSVGYYGLVAYRWSVLEAPWLQTSVSYSAYISDRREGWNNPGNYIRDLAFTVRVDVTPSWYWKVEAHDLHGYQPLTDSIGFGDDPGHRSEHWFLLAVKTGVVF